MRVTAMSAVSGAEVGRPRSLGLQIFSIMSEATSLSVLDQAGNHRRPTGKIPLVS